MSFEATNILTIEPDQVKKMFPLKLSYSADVHGKTTTFGFKEVEIRDAKHLYRVANKFAISPSFYKYVEGENWGNISRPSGGHRRNSHIIEGGRILLIDCDDHMPDGVTTQSSIIEEKLEKYFYVKVPSASNSDEKPYKWHFVIPVAQPRPINHEQFKKQTNDFFEEIGIDASMCDLPISKESARVFAPAIAKGKMTADEADEKSSIHEGMLLTLKEPAEHLPVEAAVSKRAIRTKNKNSKTREQISSIDLPNKHVWLEGSAISLKEAYEMIMEQAGSGHLSGFGCPHNNHSHSGDRTIGYGVAFIHLSGIPVIMCKGNACREKPYLFLPDPDAIDMKTFFEPQEEIRDAVLEPIHPEKFQTMVKDRVSYLSPTFQFGEKIMKGFYYFGAVFNEVLQRNLNNEKPMRLAVPAPTGSAKSVSVKLYLAYIGKRGYGGLLVVGKIVDAKLAVEEINEIAGTNVAACTYSEQDDFEGRVSISELSEYPIAVVTHNLFLNRSHTLKDIELIRDYEGKNRGCIVIDEKINFKRTVDIEINDIKHSIGLVKFKVKKNKKQWELFEKQLQNIIDKCEEKTEGKSIYSMEQSQEITKFINEAIGILKNGIGRVADPKTKGRDDIEAANRAWLINLLDRLAYIHTHSNIIIKQGEYTTLSVNEDMTNRFGSVAILDATMRSSLIYKAHMQNRDDIEMIGLPDGIRNYENSTLHIWHTFGKAKQSRTYLIHEAKELGTQESIIDTYLNILHTLVADGEPILVCTFKPLVELFKSRCKSDLIDFFHWGVHAGTNEYQHYSKVMAIGWNRKPQSVFWQDLHAINNDPANYQSFTDTAENDVALMARGELGADFVQLFNRSRSRIAVDEEGRSKKTDFYMIDDTSEARVDSGNSDEPTDYIKEEMPGLIINDTWNPGVASLLFPTTKKTIQQKEAERVIDYLGTKSGEVVSKNNVITALYGTINRKSEKKIEHLTNYQYFKDLLEENQITMTKKRGRGGGTFFDVQKLYTETEEMEQKRDKDTRIFLEKFIR